MEYIYEESDLLNRPFECFYYDTQSNKFPVSPHWHYYMEIIYMQEGSAQMHTQAQEDECVHTLNAGDMIIFSPKLVHAIYSADGKPLKYAVIKLDISRMNLTSSYSPKLRSIFKCAEKSGMDICFSKERAEKMNAEEIFRRCIFEMDTRQYGFELVIRTELYKLLINIVRSWQQDGFIIGSEVFDEDSHYDIYSITEYIDRNMSKGIKVSDVALACNMSYSYFAKRFLAVYGKTCKEYIEDMRLYKAEEFLIFTDFDINYISRETGFSDCSHLIKSFKQRRGVTPKKFREKKRMQAKNARKKEVL